MKEYASLEKNRITLGSNDGSNALIIPELIRLFHKKFHNAEVSSLTGTGDEIIRKTALGEIDIAVLRYPFPNMDKFDMIQLTNEHWLALMAKGYPIPAA